MDSRTRRLGWGWWALGFAVLAFAVHVAHRYIQKTRAEDPAVIKAESERERAHMERALDLCEEYLRAHPGSAPPGEIRAVCAWAVGAGLAAPEDFRSTRDGEFYQWRHTSSGAHDMSEARGKNGMKEAIKVKP